MIVYFLMFVGTLKPAFEMLQYSAPRSWARLAKRGGHPLWHGPKGPKMGCKEQATHPMMSPLGGLVVHFLTCFIPPNLMDYILSWSPLLCGHLEGYFLLCIDMPPLKVESHIYPQFYPYYVYIEWSQITSSMSHSHDLKKRWMTLKMPWPACGRSSMRTMALFEECDG